MTFVGAYVGEIRPHIETLLDSRVDFANSVELGSLALVSRISRTSPDGGAVTKSPTPDAAQSKYTWQMGIDHDRTRLAGLRVALGSRIFFMADSKAGYLLEELERRQTEQAAVQLHEGNFTSVESLTKWEEDLAAGIPNPRVLSKIPDDIVKQMIAEARTGATLRAGLTLEDGVSWPQGTNINSALAELGITGSQINPTHVNLTSANLVNLLQTTTPQPEPVVS